VFEAYGTALATLFQPINLLILLGISIIIFILAAVTGGSVIKGLKAPLYKGAGLRRLPGKQSSNDSSTPCGHMIGYILPLRGLMIILTAKTGEPKRHGNMPL